LKKFYVTTPIYYLNSEPHIGSAYTTIVSDIVARYKRMRNYDVFFLTGTDEHGQKVMNSAKEKGISPQDFVDQLALKFKTLWKEIGLTNDYFVRTTDKNHEETVKYIVEKLIEKGDVYKGTYKGWYCIPDETFWNDGDVKVENEKHICPECHRELKWVEEENYFFKLSKYNEKLIDLYYEKPDFVEPEFRKNEMFQILKAGLNDLSITRTTFDWGVSVTSDPKHVVYVWVDALMNYISALGYPENLEKFEKYWPADVHFIGKEINRFHSIIWPAILMALDIPLPKKIYAHGWLTVNGEKISKSKGNAINPKILMDAYGKDAVRYYLLKDISFGRDGDFSEENLIIKYNSDLANDLSNLVHRTLSMLNKYFEGVIQKPEITEEVDSTLLNILSCNTKKYLDLMDEYSFTQAMETLWEIVRMSNKYIDLTEPWILGKDENKKTRLATVLYNLLDSIRIISILINPVMPETSLKILEKIKYDNTHINENNLNTSLLHYDVKVDIGEPVFVRIDTENWKRVIIMNSEESNIKNKEDNKKEEIKKETENVISLIEFPDFTKIDLRVAKIYEAEEVKKSKKLIKLQLDLGDLGKRQIVAGIKEYYTVEELLNKKIIIVANLKPAKLMGIESNGMLLAAKDGTSLTLLSVDKDIKEGSKIS